MIPIIVSTCVDCSFAYLEDGVVKCKAFPNGIPKEYLTIKIDPKDLEIGDFIGSGASGSV